MYILANYETIDVVVNHTYVDSFSGGSSVTRCFMTPKADIEDKPRKLQYLQTFY